MTWLNKNHKNVEIAENGMISNQDIEARKWDMELNRSALESWDPLLSNTLPILIIDTTPGSLMDDFVPYPANYFASQCLTPLLGK